MSDRIAEARARAAHPSNRRPAGRAAARPSCSGAQPPSTALRAEGTADHIECTELVEPSESPPGAAKSESLLTDERGAVTAEYAVVILAGVAFAGLLVAVIRSEEIRKMLVDLVQNALGSAG